MANVPFSTLYDQLLPYLPAVERPLLDLQIRKVARDFYKRTTILRETFTFDTVAGVSDYALTPTYGEVSAIMAAWYATNIQPLPVATEDRRPLSAQGQPRSWFAQVPNIITIYPTPDAVYPMTVNAAVRPSNLTTDLPEEITNQYMEELSAGVLAAMFGMPGKPWTQSQSAKDAGRMYAGAVKTIRATIREGGQPNQSTFIAARRFGK